MRSALKATLRTTRLTGLAAIAASSFIVPGTSVAQDGYVAPEAQREIARRMERVEQAKEAFENARKLHQRKDLEGAIAEYQAALVTLPEAPMTEALRSEINAKYADASIDLAKRRAQEGRYDEAIALLETVLNPRVTPEHPGGLRLLKHLSQSSKWSKTPFGDELDRSNDTRSRAERLLDQVNDEAHYSRAMTPEHAARIRRVEDALNKAMGYYDLGLFDKAEEEYNLVLNIDQYNTGARRGIEQVENARLEYYESAYDQTRAKYMREVVETWATPVPQIGLEEMLEGARSESAGPDDGAAYISMKLQDIVLPTISFRDTPLPDAVEFLRQKSQELDVGETNPARKGVNIIIQDGEDAGPAPRITLNLTNVPLVEALRYITELAGRKYKIDPYAVKIVPLSHVGEELFTKVFRVPPTFLTSSSDGGGGVSDDPFAPSSDDGGGGGGIEARPTAKEVLEEKGISFPPESSAFFNPSTSQLVVRNTQSNMELIETYVDSLQEEVLKQIYITSKFVEIAETNLYELGFDWLLGAWTVGNNKHVASGGTTGAQRLPGSVSAANYPITNAAGNPVGTFPVTSGLRTGDLAISSNSIDGLIANAGTGGATGTVNTALGPGILSLAGVLTDPQFQVVIRAINQKKGVDLLSAPSVTARSGQRAKIEVIREFIYPTEYDPPELPDRVGLGTFTVIGLPLPPATTFPVTPANPTAFETRNTGVTLEVDPVIGADGFTIDLNLVPEVVEFQGFINYGSPIVATNGLPITLNRILMPVFGTRKVTTAVTIWDGQTVAIGGLISESVENVEDKVPIIGDVPVVGRLFRSKVNQRQKRNLTVFVTARLIDPAGQPIRKFDDDDIDPDLDSIPAPQGPPPFPTGGKNPIYK